MQAVELQAEGEVTLPETLEKPAFGLAFEGSQEGFEEVFPEKRTCTVYERVSAGASSECTSMSSTADTPGAFARAGRNDAQASSTHCAAMAVSTAAVML